ncbi:MAG: holo-[acyl-carrier-protein] synthase [Desulfuromonadales bacterium]|nr:holo-[acyl-carrier-protein] synthase [Desulfuromonadales bacterium]
MIVGIGVDIVEISRFDRFVQEENQILLDRLFTKREQGYCFAHRYSGQHFALRFAAKEAMLKALGTGLRDGMTWLDMEIVNNSMGKPEIVMTGKVSERYVASGGTACHLSLSHDAGSAVAMVILEAL